MASFGESDVTLRLVEVWFDSTWAYLMSSGGGQMVRRVDQRRKQSTSSESVCSTIVDGSIVGKPLHAKMEALYESLSTVRDRLTYRDIKDLVACCLKSSDRLYSGFSDVLPIVQAMLEEDEAYRGSLTGDEISKITLAMTYQSIYRAFCEFLLTTTKGAQAMKLLATPTKLTHSAYDLCRNKFCKLLVDEVSIVHQGLKLLVRKVAKHRRRSSPVITEPEPESEQNVETEERVSSTEDEEAEAEEEERRRAAEEAAEAEADAEAEAERRRIAEEEEAAEAEKQRLRAQQKEVEEAEARRLAEEKRQWAEAEEARLREEASERSRSRHRIAMPVYQRLPEVPSDSESEFSDFDD